MQRQGGAGESFLFPQVRTLDRVQVLPCKYIYWHNQKKKTRDMIGGRFCPKVFANRKGTCYMVPRLWRCPSSIITLCCGGGFLLLFKKKKRKKLVAKRRNMHKINSGGGSSSCLQPVVMGKQKMELFKVSQKNFFITNIACGGFSFIERPLYNVCASQRLDSHLFRNGRLYFVILFPAGMAGSRLWKVGNCIWSSGFGNGSYMDQFRVELKLCRVKSVSIYTPLV